MSYRLTPRADADLAAISDHISSDNPRAAARFLEWIEEQCRRLSDTPQLGPARPDIAPEARAWMVGRYLILYRMVTGGVEIVRVVQRARDLVRVTM